MSEGKSGETVLFSTKDIQAISFLKTLAKDNKRAQQLMHEVPSGRNLDFLRLISERGLSWEPTVIKSEKLGRNMLLPFTTPDFRYGALPLREALNASKVDLKTGKVSLLYPRFTGNGDFDPTNSEVLVFTQSQIGSLKEALKNVGH